MKALKNIMKVVAAGAAIAGIAYVILKNIDAITNWLKGLCPCCKSEADAVAEEDFAEDVVSQEVVEEASAEEATVEEAAAEEAPAEENAPAEEAVPVADGEPVADESDFEA